MLNHKAEAVWDKEREGSEHRSKWVEVKDKMVLKERCVSRGQRPDPVR